MPNAALNGSRQFQFIDELRGIAVAIVILYHALGVAFGGTQMEWSGLWRDFSSVTRTFFLFAPLWFGNVGVAIFFVISGFCIHLSQTRAQSSWLNYAFRRFIRLYPPYALSVIVALIIYATMQKHDHLTFHDTLSHLTLVHNLSPSTFYSTNPSFWSIATEAQLYAVYPFLLLSTKKNGWKVTLIGCVAMEVLLRVLRDIDFGAPFWLTESPLAYSGSWMLGAYIAHCHLSSSLPRPRILFVAPISLFALLAYFYKPFHSLQFLSVAFITANYVSYKLLQNQAPFPTPSKFSKGLASLGTVSFSLYLLHQPILEMLGLMLQTAFSLHPVIRLLVLASLVPIILYIANLYYIWIEKPFANLKGRATPPPFVHGQ